MQKPLLPILAHAFDIDFCYCIPNSGKQLAANINRLAQMWNAGHVCVPLLLCMKSQKWKRSLTACVASKIAQSTAKLTDIHGTNMDAFPPDIQFSVLLTRSQKLLKCRSTSELTHIIEFSKIITYLLERVEAVAGFIFTLEGQLHDVCAEQITVVLSR